MKSSEPNIINPQISGTNDLNAENHEIKDAFKKKSIWRDIVPTRGGGGKNKYVKCPNLRYLLLGNLF